MNDLVSEIRGRGANQEPFNYGILTADRFVKTLQDVIGTDRCYRYMAKGTTSFDDLMKKAARTLVYSNPEMVLRQKRMNGQLPRELELPKNTLMAFSHVLTSSRKDRDGDVLHSEGALVDPKMLLLWQHVHTLPIGKLIKVQSKNPNRVIVVSAIVDMNELCHDSAVMIDNGMGRFSHGFKAVKFKKTKEGIGKEQASFEVEQFEVLEESLVSVPANPDAETEEVLLSMVEGHKLTSPLLKEVGAGIRSRRNVQVPVAIKFRERLGNYEREVVCATPDQLKAVAEAGLIGENHETGPADRSTAAEGTGGEPTSEKAPADGKADDEGETSGKEMKCPECGAMVVPTDKGKCPKCGAMMEEGEEEVKAHDTKAEDTITCPKCGYKAPKNYWMPGAAEYVCPKCKTDLSSQFSDWLEKGYMPEGMKPYPNEHAARMQDPGKYDKIRRQNDKFGEGIHVMWGIDKDGKTEVQSIHFSADKFTAEQAQKWLEEHEYKPAKFEAAKQGKAMKDDSGTDTDTVEEKDDEPEGTKAGRVLSRCNEDLIRKAKEHVDDVEGNDYLQRPHRAQLKMASGHLMDVLKGLGEEGATAQGPSMLTLETAMAHFISNAKAEDRQRMKQVLDAIDRAEKTQKLVDQFTVLRVKT